MLIQAGRCVVRLVDAVLCADGPVRSLPELSLVGEHRRGHGGLAHGLLDVDRLRRAVVAGPLPRAADGRLVLGGGHHLLAAWVLTGFPRHWFTEFLRGTTSDDRQPEARYELRRRQRTCGPAAPRCCF